MYQLIRLLKKIPIIGELIGILSDFYVAPKSFFDLIMYENADNKAILLGTPTHHNIGDHLIAYNEKIFLQEHCGYSKVVEVPTRIFQNHRYFVSKYIKDNCHIFITGGGWMGDIWPEDQKIMEEFIIQFKKCKIIILPQTIYYGTNDICKLEEEINRTREVFSRVKDLTIFCRDRMTYSNAKKYFRLPNIKILLNPDMGLYIREDNNGKYSKCLAYCLREDREKSLNFDLKSLLKKYCESKSLSIREISTMYRRPVPVWEREKVINEVKKTFSDNTLVVTDRLHGMIFAAITGTRCIAIDNKTHKVKGVYDLWLKDNPNVICLDEIFSENSFINILDNMLLKESNSLEWENVLTDSFSSLKLVINKFNFESEVVKHE